MKCSSNKSHCKSKCFKIALIALIGIAALGWVVMLLWNWLMPDLFIGVKPISYCQALGVFLLSKILFGSFRGRGHCGKGRHHHAFENMTTEEREQVKGRWGQWCCGNKTDEKTTQEALPTHTEHS
jgi:hypothetical protein